MLVIVVKGRSVLTRFPTAPLVHWLNVTPHNETFSPISSWSFASRLTFPLNRMAISAVWGVLSDHDSIWTGLKCSMYTVHCILGETSFLQISNSSKFVLLHSTGYNFKIACRDSKLPIPYPTRILMPQAYLIPGSRTESRQLRQPSVLHWEQCQAWSNGLPHHTQPSWSGSTITMCGWRQCLTSWRTSPNSARCGKTSCGCCRACVIRTFGTSRGSPSSAWISCIQLQVFHIFPQM